MFSNKLFLLVMTCSLLSCVDMMIAPEAASAPNPEDYNSIAGTNSLYKVHKSPATFFDANKTCSDEGATLFYPETENESTAVLSFLINHFAITLPYSLHVGLQAKGFKLKTLDGTFINDTSMKWMKWYPNNYINRKCLLMTYLLNAKMKLKNMQCFVTLPFICKSKHIEPKQESSSQESHWELSSTTVSDSSSWDDESATTTDIIDTSSTPNSEDYNSIAGTNSLYKVHKSPATFFDANKTCSDEGATLFYPETENESTAVLSFLINHFAITLPYSLHVGLQAKGFKLKTLDGTFIDATSVKWLKWYPTNNVDRKCLLMTYRLNTKIQLKNMQCILALPFICKSKEIDQRQESSSQKLHREAATTIVSDTWFDESTTTAGSGEAESTTTSDTWYDESTTTAGSGEAESATTSGGFSTETNENEKVRVLKSRNYFNIPQTEAIYKIHLTAATFVDAKSVCEDDGASLYYPETEHESNAVTTFMQKYKGANDAYGWYVGLVRSGNNFIPSDGTSVSNTYTKWNTGEPNNAGGAENCVVFIADGRKMNDVPCTYQFYYICKWQTNTWSDESTTTADSREVESTTSSDSSSWDDESTTTTESSSQNPHREPATTTVSDTWYDESSTTAGSGEAESTTTSGGFSSETNENEKIRVLKSRNYFNIPQTEAIYKLHLTGATFNDAKTVCEDDGARLYYPETEHESNAVTTFMQKYKGANDAYGWYVGLVRSGNNFIPSDGTSVSNTYTKWNTGEPNNAGGAENCVVFIADMRKMNDVPCTYQFYYICKWQTNTWYDESTTAADSRDVESTTSSDSSSWDDESTTTTEANPGTQRTNLTDLEITRVYVNTTTKYVNINNSRTAKSISNLIENDYNFIPGTKSLYKLHTTAAKFTVAEKICNREGSILFYPETDEEIKVVLGFFKNNYGIAFPYNLHIGPQSQNYVAIKRDIDYVSMQSCIAMTFLPNSTTIFNVKPCFSLRPFICKTRISGWLSNGACNVTNDGYGYAEQLGKCYKFHLTPRNWYDARLQCRAENAELAVINSREEAAYLVRLTSSIPKMRIPNSFRHGIVLLGFHNIDVKDWQTVQGTSLYHSGYACWGNNQPDGGERQRCGSMFYNGHLNDIPCDQKAFFICEHNVVNYEHEPPPQFAAQTSLQCYDDI